MLTPAITLINYKSNICINLCYEQKEEENWKHKILIIDDK
jgi:hypothetical protein